MISPWVPSSWHSTGFVLNPVYYDHAMALEWHEGETMLLCHVDHPAVWGSGEPLDSFDHARTVEAQRHGERANELVGHVVDSQLSEC